MHILDVTIATILFVLFMAWSFWYYEDSDDPRLDEYGNEREL
jgi:hypothetical protein